MKKVYAVLITIILGLVLVGCNSSKVSSFTPKYKESDRVDMTNEQKSALLDSVDVKTSLEDTIQIGLGGSVDFSATTATNTMKMNMNLDANAYFKYADVIDDFVLYMELKEISFKIEYTGTTSSMPSNVSMNVKDSFILVAGADIYYKLDATLKANGITQSYNESGKKTGGFISSFEEMKNTINSMDSLEVPSTELILVDPFENFEVYQNDEKTVLVSKQNGTDLFNSILSLAASNVSVVAADITKLNAFTVETVVEIKDDKINGFSSIVHGEIKNFIIDENNTNFVVNATIKNFGMGARFNTTLPTLPNVTDFNESTSNFPIADLI